jgi:hypothetical protein
VGGGLPADDAAGEDVGDQDHVYPSV